MSAQAAPVTKEYSISTAFRTLADSIDALCAGYRDGAAIIHEIKRKRKGLDISAQELELSVTRRDQYEQELGELFVRGDGKCCRHLLPPSYADHAMF